ncbi:MAG: hypothetical protein FWD15_01625 [Alphaproteobacteria bacterium]|nr:hypothetical protein [Alphaproteobacteria bacterium]
MFDQAKTSLFLSGLRREYLEVESKLKGRFFTRARYPTLGKRRDEILDAIRDHFSNLISQRTPKGASLGAAFEKHIRKNIVDALKSYNANGISNLDLHLARNIGIAAARFAAPVEKNNSILEKFGLTADNVREMVAKNSGQKNRFSSSVKYTEVEYAGLSKYLELVDNDLYRLVVKLRFEKKFTYSQIQAALIDHGLLDKKYDFRKIADYTERRKMSQHMRVRIPQIIRLAFDEMRGYKKQDANGSGVLDLSDFKTMKRFFPFLSQYEQKLLSLHIRNGRTDYAAMGDEAGYGGNLSDAKKAEAIRSVISKALLHIRKRYDEFGLGQELDEGAADYAASKPDCSNTDIITPETFEADKELFKYLSPRYAQALELAYGSGRKASAIEIARAMGGGGVSTKTVGTTLYYARFALSLVKGGDTTIRGQKELDKIKKQKGR